VARQFTPADMSTVGIRSSIGKCASCSHISAYTKTVSLPMPTIKKSARKDVTVSFSAGVKT